MKVDLEQLESLGYTSAKTAWSYVH